VTDYLRDDGNAPGNGALRFGGVSLEPLMSADRDLPSTRSKASSAQLPAVSLIRDVYEGNERVKARGPRYLPQEPGEDVRMYRVRLERSVFTNFFRRTIDGLGGLVFAKDPVLGEDVPSVIASRDGISDGHWENIDLAGTHGDVFLREVFADALAVGHAAILVDYPVTNGQQTAADERDPAFPVRPYWVPIKKEQILSWRTEVIAGQTILTQIVIEESSVVPDGEFGEREETRYRVFRREPSGLVTWRLLLITDDRVIRELASGIVAGQTEIPIAEVRTSGRRGVFVSQPPLLDLAYLNIAHYQQDSDYRNSIHKTCVPIWVETGIDFTAESDGSPIILGPNTARRFTNPQASAAYVSHDGAALGAVRQSLEDLKADMGTLGLQMLSPDKRIAETATARRLDKAPSDSALAVAARGLQDAVERALYFHARYLGLESGGSILINRDFEASVLDASTMIAFATLAEKLDLPVRVILEELQAGGRFVGQDLDDLAEQIELERAARAELARLEAAPRDPTPSAQVGDGA
jgi:hypothetical protein